MTSISRNRIISVVVILFAVAAGAVVWLSLRARWGSRTFTAPAVITQIKQLHELASVRYSMQRVIGLTEPKIPVGEESILLIVQGEVQAGVDLADLQSGDVSLSGRQAVVRLAPAKILNSFLNEKETKVWDRHVTWWTPWVPYSPDLEHRARLQGLADIRKAALDSGILDRAQDNAESAIRHFLAAFGVEAKFERQGA